MTSKTPQTRLQSKSTGIDERGMNRQLVVAQLHADLHGLMMMPADDAEIREGFRKRTIEHTKAIGVAHLTVDAEGVWDLKPGDSTGRVPRRHDFVTRFGKSCQTTIERNSIQFESFLGLQAVFLPVNIAGIRPEVILILTQETDYQETIFVSEIILEYYSVWLKERSSTDNAWKLNSLAALIELVSEIENTDDCTVAAQTVVNELVRYLGCDHAAIGIVEGKKIRVRAIAGQANTDVNSAAFQINETALSESFLRDEPAIWSSDSQEKSHLLLAHEQFGREQGYTAIVSAPLKKPDGEKVGAILIGHKRLDKTNDRLFNFIRAAAPRIASAVEVVKRAEVSQAQKWMRHCVEGLKTIKGTIWIGLGVAIVAILCVKQPYKIRCGCELNAATRQFSVAPFEGIVRKFYVEPGDVVHQGDLLAEMDGQSIQFKLASVTADLQKAKKQHDIELNQGEISNALVADLETKSLTADQALLYHQKSQIEVRSPINGVVLAEQSEQSDGTSVSKGEVLFELGTFHPIVIEINIPAEEIAHVKIGQWVKVWIEGYEAKTIYAKIQKLSPRSENREGRNAFVAQIEVDNSAGRLRPGMKGHVRIDTEPKTLAWNLFHKPWNFVVSRLTWW